MESDYSQYAWLIPLFPLLAFLIVTAMGRQAKRIKRLCQHYRIAGLIYVAALIFVERIGGKVENYTWNELQWIKIGDYSLNMGFEVTNLNALCSLSLHWLVLLVNIYSKGYMKGDERIPYFLAISLCLPSPCLVLSSRRTSLSCIFSGS